VADTRRRPDEERSQARTGQQNERVVPEIPEESRTPETPMAGSPMQTEPQGQTGFHGAGRQPTNAEQMLLRQSSPQPTLDDAINGMMMTGGGAQGPAAIDGFRALASPIGKEAIQKATQILQKYKEGKYNLEQRIINNEEWYKLRHWETMRKDKNMVQPVSGWLFNCIANKHADAMDNFPHPNVLPREEGDKGQAEMLSSVIPVILDQNDFEETYDEVWLYKLKSGTGVYGVFWDSSKLNGLGDIAIEKVDIINLFWEPGITDIQESRNLFHVELVDNEQLLGQYPQLQGKLSTATIDIAKYVYDDTVDTTEKSVVVDWYYKKRNSQGKTVLHYVKYVNDEVLFASENDPQMADRGFYDHGLYPFVFDPLFRVEGTPAGFGYIDVGKSAQEYIDRGNQAIMQNMLSNARPRHFIRSDGSVNEQEYADMTKDFVHVDGNLGQDSILPINGKPLNDIYVQVINNKIDELKETTGNRDVSNGGTSSGVTASSAIAAMQEAGSKLSRDSNKSAYRAFRRICLMVIELIRQFYDLPRCFRIIGMNGVAKFVQYSNAGIVPQAQGMDFGLDMGLRIPLFDIEVASEKESPYSRMSQNELALQFYSAGFFNPMMADQALACLDMMDFDHKDAVMQRISQNGGMYMMMQQMQSQMMQLGGMVDQAHGDTAVTDSLAQQFGLQNQARPGSGSTGRPELSADSKESSITRNARQRVADSTAPR